MLKFTQGNAKLGKNVLCFNLPAGHACVFAHKCKASADRVTGKVTNGPAQEFRCYGASCEALSTGLRKLVWFNWDQLKAVRTVRAMADLIDEALTPWLKKTPDILIRIHSTGGDFFSKRYFNAWCEVAKRHPGKQKAVRGKHKTPQVEGLICYAYTKATPFMLLDRPDNFRLVASRGGTRDDLIDKHGLRQAVVCMSEDEAAEKGLACDPLDDSHAWTGTPAGNFALVIHGIQSVGSAAGKAIQANRKAGKFAGYHKKA